VPYSLQYDISGLLILIVIISLFYFKRTLPSYPNRTFALLVITIFLSVFFNLIKYAVFSYFSLSPSFALCFYGLHLLLVSIVPVPFVLYICALTNTLDFLSRSKLRFLLLAPVLINIILTAVSFKYPLIFTIDENNVYIRLPQVYIIYFFMFCYLAAGFVILLKNRRAVSKMSVYIIILFSGTSFISSLFQMYFPDSSMHSLIISLNVLIVSLTVQKSEDTSDAITGLYNQTAFEAMNFKRFVGGEKFHILGIVFDDLPFLTSTLGMRHINELLKQSSAFLKNTLKNVDVYHFNDGKFCIAFRNNDLEAVYECIDAIKERFVHPWKLNSIEVKIFPRISIISCPKDADSTETVIELFELLSSDDKYKQEGVILASSMDTAIRKRSAYIDRTVKNAISEGLLDVFYQPIYCTKQKRIIGAEALIRMKDEWGKYISPEEFIPIAEKNGTILRLGEFVFEKVCRLLSEIKPEDFGIQKIDINLSVVQCMQETLADQILNIASLYRIPSSLLNLEITETAAAYSQDTLKSNMNKLSFAGIELSLDDYGSGYSNIGYMINLPFDMIKIDKSIVWNAFLDDKSYTALAFTISMINALKMTVLAEGIETKEQADSLTSLGCHFLQGYYFSEPLPKDVFLQLLHHQSIELKAQGLIFEKGAMPAEEMNHIKKSSFTGTGSGSLAGIEELEELDSLEEADV